MNLGFLNVSYTNYLINFNSNGQLVINVILKYIFSIFILDIKLFIPLDLC